MKKYIIPALFFVAIPIIAVPLAALSLSIFGLREVGSPEAVQYAKSLNYVAGMWVGYIIWGRS